MKTFILVILCCLPLLLFCQTVIEGKWKVAAGMSTNTAFRKSPNFNLRYISPRFKWSDYDLTEEQERSDAFKNTRIMLELIYAYPLKVLCTGFNLQSRFLKYKRLSLDICGGVKFFFVPGPEFVRIPYLKEGRELWYMNIGLICQLDLGLIAPFVDVGGDMIITIGTEFNFQKIYRKPKKRYKLNT